MEADTAPKELTTQEHFFKYFQRQITEIQEQMGRLEDKALIGGERKDAADHCLASITRLATEVKDASGSLPAYDIRTYSEAIKALQEKLTDTQASFAPKQKFTFKTKKNASAISIQDAVELAAQRRGRLNAGGLSSESSYSTTPIHLVTPPSENLADQKDSQTGPEGRSEDQQPLEQQGSNTTPGQDISKSSTSTTISSRTSSYIILPASASHAQVTCQLRKLMKCCIDLSIPTSQTVPFASLTINQIQSSLLLCGSVAGPAHITGVKNSVMLISCRQFRMHECENVDIYLHCTSRPIIEDCRGVRFIQLPGFYSNLLYPHEQLTPPENLWNQVDDFKWLRAEQSPNWSILPAAEAVTESTWKEIIPSQPGKSVNEILSAVGIST